PFSTPPALLEADTVVRDRGHVSNSADLHPHVLEGPDGGVASRTGAGNDDVQLADAMLSGPASRLLGRDLGGVGGRLARTLESHRSTRGPGNDSPGLVGDGDDRVVEAGLDVGLAVGDVLALPTAHPLRLRLLLLSCHRLLLLLQLLLAGDGLARTLARASVGVGPLSTDRQAATVANSLIGADLDLPLDVLLDLPTQITFYIELLVDEAADPGHLVIGQLPHLRGGIDVRALTDERGTATPDPIDVGQADLEALVTGEVDSSDTCHQPITLASACGEGWGRSPTRAHGAG